MRVGPAPTLSRPRASLPTHGLSSFPLLPRPLSLLCRPRCLSHRDTSAFSSPFSWPPPPGCPPALDPFCGRFIPHEETGSPHELTRLVSACQVLTCRPCGLQVSHQTAPIVQTGPAEPCPTPSTPDLISPNSSPLTLEFSRSTASSARTGQNALISPSPAPSQSTCSLLSRPLSPSFPRES